MMKNILAYLGVLLAAFVFSVFYYQWFSWVLFLIIAAVPVVSLFFSLPFMLAAASDGVMLFCDEGLKTGEELNVGFVGKKNKAVLCPRMRLKISADNEFAKMRHTFKIFYGGSMKTPFFLKTDRLTRHCGVVVLGVKSCRIYDFLGIFFIPVKVSGEKRITVTPPPEKPSLMPDSEKVAVVGYKPKSGGGFSDYYELRAYQKGDSIKNIHWKASSKYDDLIVREPSLPVHRRLAVRLDLTGDSAVNDSIAARFLYVANRMLSNGSPCACLMNGGICSIGSDCELELFIIALFSGVPYKTEMLGGESPLVYVISESGEEVREL